MSERVSLWACSSCQRPTSGKSALQGPQPGSVKSIITGLPGERRASRVSVSPWRPVRLNSGAVFRWRYATALSQARLQGLQAHQKPPVLPQELDEKPPLPGQEREHKDSSEEAQQLGRRERSEPGEHAGTGSAFVALPEDEARYGGEDSVAGEGLPPGRGGVELPKAVALWRPAASQVDGDAHDEHREERQRPQSPPPGRGCREQSRGDGQFCQGQQQPERGGEGRWHSEIYEGLPRASAVGEFGCARYGEN